MFTFREFDNNVAMSCAMVDDFVSCVTRLLCSHEILRVAIATGSTLESFLRFLQPEKVPFEKIDLYIVDEYEGLSFTDLRSCTFDLFQILGEKITTFHAVKLFTSHDFLNEMATYNTELATYGLNICVLGVGCDGHVGFCYPPSWPTIHEYYTLTKLSNERKYEHTLNGWFPNVDDVPNNVITLTLWGMMNADIVFIGAFRDKKYEVIKQMKVGLLPASICPVLYLKNHPQITVYIG